MRRTTVQETVACSVMRWPPNRDFFARKESVTWSRPLRMRCLTRSHVWFPNAIASDRQSSHASFTRPPLLLQLDIVSISIWSTRSTQPNQVVSVQHHIETTSEAIGVENEDRKSTRLNSSHGYISYAVFCLKKKKKKYTNMTL